MSYSSELAETYLGYGEYIGDGTRFTVGTDHVTIHQDLDDEDEPDKYVLEKDDMSEELWTRLVELAVGTTTMRRIGSIIDT